VNTPQFCQSSSQKSSEWRSEQADILRKVEQHQHANQTYLDEGVRLLELAQRATNLYEKQEMREKRRLLDFVFSNSTWKDGCLIPTYRKPFDMLAVTNEAYHKEKAAREDSDGLFTIWLPLLDTLCNELTAPSQDLLGTLMVVRDMEHP
jgi:site-specific DNA recombinase